MDILYIAPCGRRLRTFPEIQRYLELKEVKDLNIDHFTFSRKVDVGEVWEGDKVRGEGGEDRRRGEGVQQWKVVSEVHVEMSFC